MAVYLCGEFKATFDIQLVCWFIICYDKNLNLVNAAFFTFFKTRLNQLLCNIRMDRMEEGISEDGGFAWSDQKGRQLGV